MTKLELSRRLKHEIGHGATHTAVAQAEYGWTSAAGMIRSQRRIEFLVRDISRTARVLELGAGTGVQTTKLLNHLDHLVAIDISPNLLHLATLKAPLVDYYTMDAHELQFEDNTFDAVLGVSILHHLDWDRCLKECYRILKPGGILRCSEPNLMNPQIFLVKNIPFLKRLAGDSPDEYAFTKWQIKASLDKASFTDIHVKPFEFLHPSTPKAFISFIQKIEAFLHRTPLVEFAGSLLIEAKKQQNATKNQLLREPQHSLKSA